MVETKPVTYFDLLCLRPLLPDSSCVKTTVSAVDEKCEIETSRGNKNHGLNSTFDEVSNESYGTAKCIIPSNANILYSQKKQNVFEQLEQCLRTACCWKKRKVGQMRLSRLFGEGDIALSFSGCGFLGVYHFGVLQGLNRDGKALMKRVKRCAGTSAGSLAAALWTFLPNDAEKGFIDVIKLAAEIHSLRFGVLSPDFVLHKKLQKIIDLYIPVNISDAQDRLYISVTHQKNNVNRLISQFISRDYLIDCLLASCYIPIYSGSSPPTINGDQYIDGGFTNNLATFEDLPTITVSPFSGNAVIAPNDYNSVKPFREWRLRVGTQEMKVNVQNMIRGAQALFPPSLEILKNYYEMGQRDAMRFLLDVGVLERQVMFTIQVLKKRVLYIFRLVLVVLGRLCCCFKRRKNIGELPYTVAHQSPQTFLKSVANEEQWKGWSETPFVSSVEDKIIEYRRKKAEPEVVTEEKNETDFFNDMQPKVLQTQRQEFPVTIQAYVGNVDDTEIRSSNLFAVKTDQMLPSYFGELGTLEDGNAYDETEEWDTQIDIEGVNNVLREQRAKERQERRLARQMEQAKRLERRKQ
uniref:PNPLA domain-containing protein n=1 Tax=Setaria digitata TaxID=48799 RepID=A0A915PCM1_9BILA